ASAPPMKDEAKLVDREKGDDGVGRRAASAPTLRIATVSATGLGDTAALRAALEARLAAVRHGCPARPGQAVLRLTVDAAGRVVAIEAVSGDSTVAAYLRARLAGLTSATRPTGPTGTWTVTLAVSR